MTFHNKDKYSMYRILLKFDKCKSIHTTKELFIKKHKMNEYYFSYIIGQMVERQLIDGIKTTKSLNNCYHNIYAEHIYITYNGYEFIKDYYGWLKRLLRDLFLIFVTAYVTVTINNKLDNTKQSHAPECQFYSNK